MLQKLELHFNKIFWALSAVMAVIVALRCYLVPFAHDEVATFYFYIQPESFMPFTSHVDANGHFLTNLTSWLSYKVFGSALWSLRLPNIFAFAILCLATFKLCCLLNSFYAKTILLFGFIVSYHFISFYSLCRGYGISMAFLVLALYYFFSVIQSYSLKHFVWFLLSAHLALSANLTLVFVLLICSATLMVFQFIHKKLFNLFTIGLWLISLGGILFWIKYAFFLQHNGALYYGSGDSYWQVTFVSLIETIFFKNIYFNYLILFGTFVLLFYWLYAIRQQGFRFLLNSQFAIAFLVFIALVLSFYLLKLLLKVNYPEDRTGLFFYVFFVLALAFKVNESRHMYQQFSFVLPIFCVVHLLNHVNLSTHPWRIYETFPTRFLTTLVEEQKKSKQKITIAGHRLREFIYGFINYNTGGQLNHITSPEALQMNADYAIAYKMDAPYYNNFYDEIDSEKAWDFVLLKRKKSIERELIYAGETEINVSGEPEYINAYEKLDTTFNSNNPLLAEFNLNFAQVPVPFNAWLVLQIDDADEGKMSSLVRVPLNLIQKDFNGQSNQIFHVLSGNIPTKIKRIVCYVWNIDKKPVQFKIQSFKLYRLKAEGIQIISQAKI